MQTICTSRPGPGARWLIVMLGAALGGCDPGVQAPAAGQPATPPVTPPVSSPVSRPVTPPAPDYVTSTLEDTILQGSLPLATDPDGGPVLYTLYTDAHAGNVQLAADGTFTYMPQADFYGTDSFRYHVRDGRGTGTVSTVQVSVLPVNDAPRIRTGPAPVVPISSGKMAILPWSSEANAVALDAEGRIHVAGSLRVGGGDQFAVARYTGEGVLDLGYGRGDGIATASLGAVNSAACRIVIDSAGRSIVAVRSESDGVVALTIVRFTTEGAPDTTFGAGSGKVTTPIRTASSPVFGLALDGSGRILVAGASTSNGREDFTVARYSNEGVLDATFGVGGVVTTRIGSGNSGARDVAVDQSGRLVVVGASETSGRYHRAMTIARYTDTGVLDPNFGDGNGVVVTSLPGSALLPAAMVLDKAGRIVVAGDLHSDGPFWGTQRPMVARYTADGALDASFGGGIVRIWLGETDDWSSGADVALDVRGNVLVTGTSEGYVRQVSAMVRYTDSGILDTTFGTGTGIVATAFGHGAAGNGIALDGSGRVLVVGSVQAGSHNAMTVARYLEEGVLDPGFNSGGDQTFWFALDRRFYDVDGDALAYSVSLGDGSPLPDMHLDATHRVVSGKVPAEATALVVTATDPEGLSATETYEFLRVNAN